MQTTDFVMVQTTTDSLEETERLASVAVEGHLAACVQVSQVESFYHWQGAVHRDPEYLLTLKTTTSSVSGIKQLLAREHSYEEPELIVVPIVDGDDGYLAWVRETSSSQPSD